MRDHLTAVRGACPDCSMGILRQYADGEMVISEFILEGTLAGGSGSAYNLPTNGCPSPAWISTK